MAASGTGAYESGGNLDAINTAATALNAKAGNADNIVVLASGLVTANGNSTDQSNPGGRGIKLFINTGAFGAGFSAITVTIQGKDPVSGQYYTILTSAALTASAFQPVLSAYPGLAVTANVSVNDVLPKTWRVTWQATAWGTGGSTLGIGAALIV